MPVRLVSLFGASPRLMPPAGIDDALASTHPACVANHDDAPGKTTKNLRPRVLAAAVVSATVAVMATAASDDATAQRKTCRVAERNVLAQGPLAVAYRVRAREGSDVQLKGCLRSTGRRTVLGDGFNVKWFGRPARAVSVHGSMIGYATQETPDGVVPIDYTRIVLRSLRSKAQPRVIESAGKPLIGSLAVTNRGDVAWIECPSSAGFEADPRPNCVRAGLDENRVMVQLRGSTSAARLAVGTAIDPTTVRLKLRSGERRVSWVQDGKRRGRALRI